MEKLVERPVSELNYEGREKEMPMKERYPSVGTEVEITSEMCDLNGHMNVVFYYQIFEDGCSAFFEDMGFSPEYFDAGFSNFTLETNLKYLKEMKQGEIALPCYRIFDLRPKLIHYGGVILNKAGEISAAIESVVVHIDMKTRRSCEMGEEMYGNLERMFSVHEGSGDLDFELRLSIRK
ncbi:MAG: hypothetical protein CMQ40_09455 [Gammaproteobacteria bacterium]|nr:hypothetical protein [Gammaproteobacteria bacterium]